MDTPENVTKSVRSVSSQNARTTPLADGRVEQELAQARKALEVKTRELIQWRERFQVTLANVDDAVIITDTQCKVTHLNPKAETMTGWKSGEATGQALDMVFRIINERTRQPSANPAHKALAEGISFDLANNIALVAKSGQEIAVEGSSAPIKDGTGKISGAVVDFHDAGERRTVEAALRISNDQFSAIINNSPLRVFLVDSHLTMRQINTKARLAFGNGENLIGRELGELLSTLWPPPVAAQVVARFRHTLETGEPFFSSDLPGSRADRQRPEYFSWEIQRVTMPDGQQGAACYITDISHHILDQQELQKSENRKSAILSASLDAIITMNHEGKVSDFNPAAEGIFGFRRDEVLGKLLAELIIPERFRQQHHAGLARYLATSENRVLGRRIEMSALRADGQEFPIELSISRIPDSEPPEFTATLRDITHRKRVEKELLERARFAALRADISTALAKGGTLPAVFQQCAQALVTHLDAAFARIWTLNEAKNVLELQASAGLYTHLDGPHGRIEMGAYKIGCIAQHRQPLLTNDVVNDENISDHDWARREGMVAFAGYPLVLENQVLGVMALFAKHSLTENLLGELGPVADGLAQWVRRRHTEEALSGAQHELEQYATNLELIVEKRTAELRKKLANSKRFHTLFLMI